MRMIFKVSFYVRSNYENKSGKSPLMIRIYLGTFIKYYKISQLIHTQIIAN